MYAAPKDVAPKIVTLSHRKNAIRTVRGLMAGLNKKKVTTLTC